MEQALDAPHEQKGIDEGRRQRNPPEPAVGTGGSGGGVLPCGAVLLDLVLRNGGEVVAQFSTDADPNNADDLADVLLAAIRRSGGDDGHAAEYELDVRRSGALLRTFVVSRPRARGR